MRKKCVFDGCEKYNFAHGYCSGHAAQIRRGSPLAPLTRQRPLSSDGFNWCSKCKQHKPVTRFSQDKKRGGLDRVCHDCRAEYQRAYNAKNKDQISVRVTIGKYGFSETDYLALFEAQDFKCAICGVGRRKARRHAVDHDHKTGLIRGLLCQDCNLGMGQFADDPDLMQKAVNYLRAGGIVHNPNFRIPETSWKFKRAQERDANRARNHINDSQAIVSGDS